MRSYTIRPGDTMWAISRRYGVSLAALEKANPQVKNPNLIYAGDTLHLPGVKDGFDPAPRARRGVPGAGPGGVHEVSGPMPGGSVGQWIKEAMQILEAHGVPASKMNPSDIALIIQHESGGNPNAQNNWDSNAAAGHPSIGLMQTIGPTFESYKLPGHDDIRNPVDNIIAGVRYAISRYGSISNVPGVENVHRGGAYVGY